MSEVDVERLAEAVRRILDAGIREYATMDAVFAVYGEELFARLAESRPSDGLAAARFVATHWRDAYLEQHRTDPSGQWAIGTHPLSLVLAALDGERDPVHLGLPAEVHGAFRAALAAADADETAKDPE
jgi:hypothetical protein